MASFLWSIRVYTMEICGRIFFFYNNIYFSKNQNNRHCVTCYVIPWSKISQTQLSTNQRARIRSVILKLSLMLASIHALCYDLSQRCLKILPLPALFPSDHKRLILRHALLSKLQSSVKYTIFFYYLKDSVVT